MAFRKSTIVVSEQTLKMAALLTPSLLHPVSDDAPENAGGAMRIGTSWLRWGDVNNPGNGNLPLD